AVAACLQASDRMTALVDGLLTLARADAGKLDLQREPVDLRKVTESTVALLGPLAAAQGVAVAARLEPAEVPGDADRLTRVVTNLVSNAIQYNRPGGQVRVSLGTAYGAAVLTVADTG